jgi:hypothetical protein
MEPFSSSSSQWENALIMIHQIDSSVRRNDGQFLEHLKELKEFVLQQIPATSPLITPKEELFSPSLSQ